MGSLDNVYCTHLLILSLNMEMNEILEIINIMLANKLADIDFDGEDPCSFFESSIIFPILQSLENWDTGIINTGIQSFSFLANYVTLIFFCHSVDFQYISVLGVYHVNCKFRAVN